MDQDTDILTLSPEQFDLIASKFSLRGRTCRVFRYAAVDGLSICEIAQVESEHADGPVSYETVAALLDEARVVMWQAAGATESQAREMLDAYRNRQPSAGKTPGDVTLRSPVEGVEDLRDGRAERWRSVRVDALGRSAGGGGR